jgi:hypothetical protein
MVIFAAHTYEMISAGEIFRPPLSFYVDKPRELRYNKRRALVIL